MFSFKKFSPTFDSNYNNELEKNVILKSAKLYWNSYLNIIIKNKLIKWNN